MLKSEIRRIREDRILSQLDKGGIMTVEQLRKVTDLGVGGRANALRVLREMERSGLVVSKHVGVKLFSSDLRSRFGFREHTLMRNDFLIDRGWFELCKVEVPIRKGGEVVLRADAGVFMQGEWLFIEIDRRQTRRANLAKFDIYKDLGLKFVVVCRNRHKYFPEWVKTIEIG